MDVVWTEYSGYESPVRQVSFYSVPLTKGKGYDQNISGSFTQAASSYNLISQTGEEVSASKIDNYVNTASSQNATVEKLEQILQGTQTYRKKVGDVAFALDTKLTTGDGKLSYASSNKSVATVSADGIVTIKGAGNAEITVTAAEMDSYKSAVFKITLTVAKKTQTDSESNKTESCTHKWSKWKTKKEATVSAPAKQVRTCSKCKKTQTRNYGKKLTPKIKLTASSLTMKTRQSTTAFKAYGFANGDYLKNVTSSNTKILTVSNVKKTGAMKLTAQKKKGKVTLTLTMASGLTKKVTVNVQKKTVKTTSIAGVQKSLTIKKGNSITLKPTLSPITSQQKITFKSSNKKVVTVSSKGVVKAVKKGTATITVKSGKKKVTCKITVK